MPETDGGCVMSDSEKVSMKPLLAVAVKEAVLLAIIDSLPPPGGTAWAIDGTQEHLAYLEERRKWLWSPHSIPDEVWVRMDPLALAQNVCVRLLGVGGWVVNGVYAGNATPRQILDASIERPDQDPLGDVKNALGVKTPNMMECDRCGVVFAAHLGDAPRDDIFFKIQDEMGRTVCPDCIRGKA